MTYRALIQTLALGIATLACLAANGQDSIRWAYMADLHISVDGRSAKDLEACVMDINAQKPDFVIVAGDVTNFGADDEIRLAKSLLDKLEVPCHVVPGNHDAKWSESGCNSFKEIFGGEQFEFHAGGWRFIGCASGPNMRMAPALIPRENMVWLNKIASKEKEKTIFINHYPLDSSVLNYFDVTKVLHELDTRLVMSGHWHVNRKMTYDAIPGIIGRSSLSTSKVTTGYNMATLEGEHIAIHERRLGPDGHFEDLATWYEANLTPTPEASLRDAHGLPEDYPWMGYGVNDRYPSVKEVWTQHEDSDVAAGFAVDQRQRYAWYPTTSGELRCIRIKDGKLKWSRSLPGKIFSTPVYGRSGRKAIVTVGCADGKLYALNAGTGDILWHAEASKSILSSPVIHDGKVYFGASDGVFRCVKLEDGAKVWEYDGVGGFVECRPWIDEDGVYFGAWDREFYCLDSQSGSLRWKWNVGKPSIMYSPAACWPVKSGSRVFVAVPDRRIYVLDAKTGKELFHTEGGREQIGLSEDGERIFVKTMHHSAYCFEASAEAHGDVLSPEEMTWHVQTCLGYDIAPTPTVCAGGLLLIPTDKGNIIALSEKDGSHVWSHKLSPSLVNPLSIISGRKGGFYILSSTFDGTISLLTVER